MSAEANKETNHHLSSQWLKPAVEFGPLLVFFAVYVKYDLLIATGALMAATAAGLAASLLLARRVPIAPLVTAVVVGIFGGLTLWSNNEIFIKMKPTIVQAIISLTLFAGLAFDRALLKPVLGMAWPMDDVGWRRLTTRYAFFFAGMAVLNELVWRTQATDVWVTFKVFGILGFTVVFALFQAPLMGRHHLPEDSSKKT